MNDRFKNREETKDPGMKPGGIRERALRLLYKSPVVGNDDSAGEAKMRDCGAQGNTHTRS